MDRALFSWRARTRRRRLAHSFACALCAQHVVSDTRRNCACEKFKAAVARVCARASYYASPHTNVCVRVYVRTRRVSLALMYLLFFPSILFPRFHCLALSFSPSLSPLSLSISPADNAAKTADLGLLTMSVGSLIRYVSRRALRYS